MESFGKDSIKAVKNKDAMVKIITKVSGGGSLNSSRILYSCSFACLILTKPSPRHGECSLGKNDNIDPSQLKKKKDKNQEGKGVHCSYIK